MQSTAIMAQILANWPAVAGVALLLLAVAAWLFGRRKAPRVRRAADDVLSEGAARASRNTALMAAPPVASLASTMPAGEPAMAVEPVVALTELGPDAALDAAPADDLARIKGLGPKLRARLADLGITRFDQIAAWSVADLAAIDAQLGSFAGRPAKDSWIEQARLLASGDVAAYEDKFGKM